MINNWKLMITETRQKIKLVVDSLVEHPASIDNIIYLLDRRLALGRSVLLKQQLARMNSWLTKAERKMKQGNSLGPNYEAVKKKLEDHQVTITQSVELLIILVS